VTFICSLCLLIISAFLGFFFINRENDIVTKTGVHYLPFIFGGALLSQLVGLSFMNFPLSGGSCTLLQYISGLAPTLMFSAIVVKNRKVYQIFISTFKQPASAMTSMTEPPMVNLCPPFIEERLERMMKPKTRQVVSIFIMITIQFLIVSIWKLIQVVHSNTGLLDEYPADRHIRICSASINEFILIQTFNLVLIVLCTVYGYMTRHVRSDFNETKYISISMFTVTLIWLCAVFIIMAALEGEEYGVYSDPNEPELKVAVLSMVLSFSGLSVILIMFTNRVYLVVKSMIGKKEEKPIVKTGINDN